MYESFYKLKTTPFGASPDPRFLYMMPHTREALAGLEYGISARKGIIVLTGEVGTGKTTLLRAVLPTFGAGRVVTSFVFNPRFEVLDFLEFVLTDFGIPPVNRTKSGMLLQLNRWLIENYRNRQTPVIIVDEAQNCSWDLLEEIRLLTNLETSSEKLVQIILAGQPELEDTLRQANMRQLRQRIALWCRTSTLTRSQTGEYIKERLRIAGTTEQIFLPEAVDMIHNSSCGIPRTINLICEHALIFAYVEQTHKIPGALIEDVVRNLELDVQPFVVTSSTSGVLPAASQDAPSSSAAEKLRPHSSIEPQQKPKKEVNDE